MTNKKHTAETRSADTLKRVRKAAWKTVWKTTRAEDQILELCLETLTHEELVSCREEAKRRVFGLLRQDNLGELLVGTLTMFIVRNFQDALVKRAQRIAERTPEHAGAHTSGEPE